MTTSPEEIIAAAVSHLANSAERLRSLDLSNPAVADVACRSNEVLGGHGPLWLVEYSQVV